MNLVTVNIEKTTKKDPPLYYPPRHNQKWGYIVLGAYINNISSYDRNGWWGTYLHLATIDIFVYKGLFIYLMIQN